MARTMFDVHRESSGPTPLKAIADSLVRLEVDAVKRGFQQHVQGDAALAITPDLAERLADPRWPGTSAAALRAAADAQLADGSSEVRGAGAAIAAAFLYYSAVLQIFVESPEVVDEWMDHLADEPDSVGARSEALLEVEGGSGVFDDDALIDSLALVHRTLPLDPIAAIRQLRRIHVELAALETGEVTAGVAVQGLREAE